MPKKLDQPTEKVSIRLFVGDAETLGQFYHAVGYNAAIRAIIARHCRQLRERASREGVSSNVGSDPAIAESIDAALSGADLAP